MILNIELKRIWINWVVILCVCVCTLWLYLSGIKKQLLNFCRLSLLTYFTDCQYIAYIPLHKSSRTWALDQNNILITVSCLYLLVCKMRITILSSSLDVNIQEGNECIVHDSAWHKVDSQPIIIIMNHVFQYS